MVHQQFSQDVPSTSAILLRWRDELTLRLRTAWPSLELNIEPFIDWLGSTIQPAGFSEASLAKLNVEELYLAFACSNGDVAALRIFDIECSPELVAIAARLRLTSNRREDIRQMLWMKLFVGTEASPKRILEYRGSGRLRHWFRVVAMRFSIDEARKSKSVELPLETSPVELSDHVIEDDAELSIIRQQYRNAFRVAFKSAIAELEPEERNLIRCHYVLGMSTEQIGRVFGIHKATAARRLARAREELLATTRQSLKSRLRFNSVELDSAMRLFPEELTTSIASLLA